MNTNHAKKMIENIKCGKNTMPYREIDYVASKQRIISMLSDKGYTSPVQYFKELGYKNPQGVYKWLYSMDNKFTKQSTLEKIMMLLNCSLQDLLVMRDVETEYYDIFKGNVYGDARTFR